MNAKSLQTNTWGGSRTGSGRKASSVFVPHVSRPEVAHKQHPVEIILKIRSGHAKLRSARMMTTLMRASLRARRFGLRIIHYRAESRSLILICEFKNRDQLERSFKSLNTTLAIALKRRFENRHKRAHNGPVFLDRYRLVPLTTPLAVKQALRFLYLHEATRRRNSIAHVRPYPASWSSSAEFHHWQQLLDDHPLQSGGLIFHETQLADNRAQQILASPQFALTRHGWYSWSRLNS